MDKNNDNQTEILREILKWIKFSGMKDVKRVLLDNLSDETKKIIYNYSDGDHGTEFIKKIANVKGNNVVPNLWDKWKNLGIIEKVSVKGGERGKKIFNLEDFGIEIPIITLELKKNKEDDTKIEPSKENLSDETPRENQSGEEE